MAIFNENVSGKMMEDDQLDSRLPHSWPMGKGCELCWPSGPACFAAWMPFLLRQIWIATCTKVVWPLQQVRKTIENKRGLEIVSCLTCAITRCLLATFAGPYSESVGFVANSGNSFNLCMKIKWVCLKNGVPLNSLL